MSFQILRWTFICFLLFIVWRILKIRKIECFRLGNLAGTYFILSKKKDIMTSSVQQNTNKKNQWLLCYLVRGHWGVTLSLSCPSPQDFSPTVDFRLDSSKTNFAVGFKHPFFNCCGRLVRVEAWMTTDHTWLMRCDEQELVPLTRFAATEQLRRRWLWSLKNNGYNGFGFLQVASKADTAPSVKGNATFTRFNWH